MSRTPDAAAFDVSTSGEAVVYMLRVWVGMPRRPGFRALVRPIGSEQWLGFASAEDLVEFLVRQDTPSSEDKR